MMPRDDRARARALVERLNRQARSLRQREIVAPLVPGGRVRTRLDGLVYEFTPDRAFTGWGRFRPVSERAAAVLGEALPWQRGGWLEQFPPLRVILLEPDPRDAAAGRWWALPFNEGDAAGRFGLPADEAVPVLLCDPLDGAERFQRVVARVDGRTLWYDGADPRADPAHAEWLRGAAAAAQPPDRLPPGLARSERRSLLLVRIRSVEQAWRDGLTIDGFARLSRAEQEALLDRLRRRQGLEDRLRYELGKADAEFRGVSIVPGPDGAEPSLLVEWAGPGGQGHYRTLLTHDLTVVSSGICLNDRDRDFDLTSLVSVMRDAE